jgi:hypothetical protein
MAKYDTGIGEKMIKRSPFDFETPKDLDAMLHGYIDVLEGLLTMAGGDSYE